MHRRPIVSVIIPIYNGSAFLRETIESILRQSFCDFELLLIDDGSTDGSPDIARSYAAIDDRIILITKSRNHGVVHALNAGLRSASGAFIARLDHDDVAIAHRLEAQVQYLLTHPSVVVVGSNMLGITATGEVLGELWSPEQPDQIRFAMLLNNAIADPTVMCRAGTIAQHSLCYHPLNVAAEDYAMWATIIQYGDAYNLRDRLTYYRLHANQMSNKLAATQQCSADRISAAQIAGRGPISL